MKKLAALLFTVVFASMTQAADFKEGTHYTVVSNGPATTKPEVVEFFSFLCPACYRFEPLVANLKSSLPSNVAFNKSHVDFLGGSLGKDLSRAFAIAKLLKVEDKVIPAVFNAVHVEKRRFANLDDLRTLFIDHGVDAKKFDGAAKSFIVNGKVSKMLHNTKKFQVRGVPTFVVNGKYQVNNKALKSAEDFDAIVAYLAQKKD